MRLSKVLNLGPKLGWVSREFPSSQELPPPSAHPLQTQMSRDLGDA
jgi:hypothetical protein